MNIKHLNTREKLLAAAIIVVMVLGSYAYLRFEPRLTQIELLEAQREKTLLRISTMEIPDEPQEQVDEIIAQLDDQEKALEAIKDNARQVEMLLAPVDSQELRVRISELARDSGIRIRVNQTFRVDRVTTSSKRAPAKDVEIIVPPSAGWTKRLAPGSMYVRPMQRLEIDGDYPSLRRFIHGLEDLPYQVTVVRINVEKLDVAPLRGMSQLLKTELVLAL